jgi:hypothetical protein
MEELCSESTCSSGALGITHTDSHTTLNFRQEAVAWEDRLARLAPDRVRHFARQQGDKLLAKTENARDAASRYYSLVRASSQETNCDYLVPQLRLLVCDAEWREARRLADAAVADITMLSVYEAAALALLLFGQRVEGVERPFQGARYHDNHALMWRMSLIADRLFRDATFCTASFDSTP